MSALAELIDMQKEVKLWETIQNISFWDQMTGMPAKGSSYRGDQNALLARTRHALITSSKYEDLVLKAHEEVSSYDDAHPSKVQVKRIKETFDKSKKLPQSLVEAWAKASVSGSAAWEKAKESKNVGIFTKELENLVKLAHEKAEAYGYEDHAYDALLEDFEPEMTVKDLDALYNPIKDPLAQLVKDAQTARGYQEVEGAFDVKAQDALGKKLAEALGFAFDNGTMETSSHPFSITMGADDFRITTRYMEKDPFSAFYATAHEVGHSLYERGLSKENFGTPLGTAATAGIHESQSLFWENRICRSPEFLTHWHKEITTSFPSFSHWSPKDLVATANRVQPGFIRVDADETTYCLHIIVRYEIEKQLFSGQLKVSEVEEAWNEAYKRYLGLDVVDPTQGCLQDVHWSEGLFGYFPSYALGHILSAQFSMKMDQDIGGIDNKIQKEDYPSILHWLRTNIHNKGQTFYAKDLIRNIAGEELSGKPFLNYLKAKAHSIFA